MEIKPLEEKDLGSFTALQPAEWNDITPMHVFYLSSSFCHPIKVIIDDTVAGIGTAIIHPDTAWLAHIIVHPNYRKKGLGTLITQSLLDLTKNKETIYLLATDLGEPIYTKLGFVAEAEHIFYKEGDIDPSWKTSKWIVPFEEKHTEEILRLDRIATGEDREIRLKEFYNTTSLFLKDDKVQGFYMKAFGEGLVIADNPDSGVELMKFRLMEKPIAILPSDNKEAIKFLLENNFKEFRKAKRMRLGKVRILHPELIYNRVSGQIG